IFTPSRCRRRNSRAICEAGACWGRRASKNAPPRTTCPNAVRRSSSLAGDCPQPEAKPVYCGCALSPCAIPSLAKLSPRLQHYARSRAKLCRSGPEGARVSWPDAAMFGPNLPSIGLLLLFAGIQGTTARADAIADFYKGRQVKLVIGVNAGGSYDAYGRL